MDTIEVFKEVDSKGVRWKVSKLGRIWVDGQTCVYTRERLGKIQVMRQIRKGTFLSPYRDKKNGYLEVARKVAGGKRIKERVHRLVGMAFVDGYKEGLTINHIDGDKSNNRTDNLEWVSLAENTKHQWGMGLAKAGTPKLTSKQVVYMRRLYRQGIPGHTIDIIAGVTPGYTQMLCKGQRRKSVLG